MKDMISPDGKVYSPTAIPKGQLTAKELQAYVGMSWTSIQKYFFHLEGFPKRKIGNKWYFHKERLDVFLDDYFDA